MKSIIIFLIALIPLCSVCNAQPKHRNDIHSSIKVDPSLLASFKAREYVVNGQTIRYREAINSTNSRKAPCLVIFLHGHSGSGDDNQSQMANQGINAILNYLKKSKTQAIMLVPQCPKEYTWSGMEGGNKNKGHNPYIKSLIDHYVTTMGIDVSKIYILGASMGSMGT